MALAHVIYFFTPEFLIFFVGLFALYWLIPHNYRKYLLLVSSMVFYACWDYRFLPLILFSATMDYTCALRIQQEPHRRKFYMWLSTGVHLAILSLFKYYNFFVENAFAMLSDLGLQVPPPPTLHWIIPLGISFYTFQSLSYVLDVYRGKMAAEKNFSTYALYVMFFPQLIAGPIERGSFLLPQLINPKFLRDVVWTEGLYLFAYGWFKKRVIADYLDVIVNQSFKNPNASGVQIMISLLAAALQLYCDVSGYADMARGIGRFLGIQLSSNFNFPYFSKNPVDFWKRWHITLSQWIRHYVHTPLITRIRRPIFVMYLVFIVMGFWHEPSWKFILWGIYWASASVVYQTLLKRYLISRLPWLANAIFAHASMIAVFVIGQSLCRSQGVEHFISMLQKMVLHWNPADLLSTGFIKTYACIAFIVLYEQYPYRKNNEFALIRQNFYVQSAFYVLLYFLYRNIGNTAMVDFVYFNY